jgi:hypothetical protein
MRARRTDKNQPGKNKISRNRNSLPSDPALDHALVLVDAVCRLAGDDHLIGNRKSNEINWLRRAIENHNTPYLFDRLLGAFSLQGISDHAAYVYMERHGRVTWRAVERTTTSQPRCPKLRCYWTFHDCGYQKDARTCTKPGLLATCPLPEHDLRNGRLNQTAYSLFLFIRDVADGDLIGWIDGRFDQAALGTRHGRTARMRTALIEPLRNLFGVSDKVLNMALADLLSSAPPTKPLWLETAVNMNAIDRLVHAFMHRTGILRRFKAEHAYGPACYRPEGCAEIIGRIAARIDAKEFNPNYPRFFPRFLQHAIYRYCAQLELNVCNGNKIDDRYRCGNEKCPLYPQCDRVALHPIGTAGL